MAQQEKEEVKEQINGETNFEEYKSQKYPESEPQKKVKLSEQDGGKSFTIEDLTP